MTPATTARPTPAIRDWFVDGIVQRMNADRLVFAGLVLWDVQPSSSGWVHRIEVQLVDAVERAPTPRETVRRLMSEYEFRACAREVRAL
jgi:hypothetical protein